MTLLRSTLLKAAIALSLSAGVAPAQDFPSRPPTWVVGFAPGGISDQGTRFVAKVLGEKLGQPIVVDNKPGAGGIVAAESVAAAKPDGYTMLYASNGVMGTHKFLYKKLSFDPLTSFTLIHGFGSSPMLMVVPADSPFKTLKDLIEHAKKNPEKLSYGSVGPGTASHLVAELLAKHTGAKFVHVPYKGSSPAMADLMAKRLDFMFDYSIVVKPQMEGGKLRALASSGETRLTSHPEVQTIREQGYPEVVLTAWATLVGPANMPQPVVDKIADAFSATLKEPSVIKYHDDQGVTLFPDMRGDKLKNFIISEQAKFKDIVERAGIQPE